MGSHATLLAKVSGLARRNLFQSHRCFSLGRRASRPSTARRARLLLRWDRALRRQKPEHRNDPNQRQRGCGPDPGHGNGGEIQRNGRDLLAPTCVRGPNTLAAYLNPERHIAEPRKNADCGVERGGERREAFDADPVGGERKQREAEEKHQVGPQNTVGDRLHLVDEIVMVDPVNPDLHEGEQIEKDGRQRRAQAGEAVGARHLELQHHDGDDDRDDAVGKRLETRRTQAFFAHTDTTIARGRGEG